MTYLIVQTFVLLLIAAMLGMLLGWYLTRIAAAAAEDTLRRRADNTAQAAEELRAERDAAVQSLQERDRQYAALAEESAQLREPSSNSAQAAAQAAEIDALRAGLEQCRASLAAAKTTADSQQDYALLQAELAECRSALELVAAPASASEREVDSRSIMSAAASAARGASGLLGAHITAQPVTQDVPDDLQQIKGIGPKIAALLGRLGIERFEQIAAWSAQDIARINAELKFSGRIERENWIPQAQALIAKRAAAAEASGV